MKPEAASQSMKVNGVTLSIAMLWTMYLSCSTTAEQAPIRRAWRGPETLWARCMEGNILALG